MRINSYCGLGFRVQAVYKVKGFRFEPVKEGLGLHIELSVQCLEILDKGCYI